MVIIVTNTTIVPTSHLAPFSWARADSMQLIPKMGRCEIRPTFEGSTRNDGGVVNRKREDGISPESNEAARHAHGKRFTGAKPESELVASSRVARAFWTIVHWPGNLSASR